MSGVALALVIIANFEYFYFGTSIETVAVLLASALIVMVGDIAFSVSQCQDRADG